MTAKPWVVRPAAHREVDEVAASYEEKRPGLGYELIEAHEAALAALQADRSRFANSVRAERSRSARTSTAP